MRRRASDPFRAIADPTRRALLDHLRAGPKTVTALARPFARSLPAISQHLRVLKEAGFVTERRQGRERYYRACPAAFRRVAAWVAKYEVFWSHKLDALEQHLARKR